MRWSLEEDNFVLEDLANHVPVKVTARNLHRTPGAIYVRRQYLTKRGRAAATRRAMDERLETLKQFNRESRARLKETTRES